MIRLENVSKIYPDGTEAVNSVSLEINEGELCVLLGPSGCGKTTTMKMINRLIPITEGKIYIDGTDNQELDENELRRDIGYAIQEIGLFPHMTVAENIATVPKLKGWSQSEARNRADELLELMGMDPSEHLDKYPVELSGGQRQRVGVARSLGANPPIMLMDEPFGAIDPITRDKLQDEFLKIQEEIQKTIVFVTHDINEAIKMGTKIALLKGGELIQYSSPAELLARPKNQFVRDFVGTDRTLKSMRLMRAKDAMKPSPKTVRLDSEISEIREKMKENEVDYLIVTDGSNRFRGWIRAQDLEGDVGTVDEVLSSDVGSVSCETALSDALSVMLEEDVANIPVLGNDNKLEGILTFNDLQKVIGETYTEEGGGRQVGS
ncbi:MAG: betaine/proline/choline family ABC transporter ATP-binding protein [Candidatus Bipolaricaulota bacterium]|nr:betaine/proline/choline family ABC transporter ATP-binding protein [Candidatus Bipolaricaulota bacterium]